MQYQNSLKYSKFKQLILLLAVSAVGSFAESVALHSEVTASYLPDLFTEERTNFH